MGLGLFWTDVAAIFILMIIMIMIIGWVLPGSPRLLSRGGVPGPGFELQGGGPEGPCRKQEGPLRGPPSLCGVLARFTNEDQQA